MLRPMWKARSRTSSARAPRKDGESVVLIDHNRPLAWSGEMRIDPDTLRAPISVSFSPFYTTLNVVKVRGDRRAVASVVLHAAPPADRLTQSMDSLVAAAQGVASYEFAPVADPRGGPFVIAYKGAPLARVIPRLATGGEIGFRRAAMLRARGTIALVILYACISRLRLARPACSRRAAVRGRGCVRHCSDRSLELVLEHLEALRPRLLLLQAGRAAHRECRGALHQLGARTHGGVRRDSRSPRVSLAATVCGGCGAVVTLGIGIPFAFNIVRGIGQPPWGSTPGLWLSWEIPLFLFLFAVLLAAYWMLRMAFGQTGSVSFRAAVIVASISGVAALAGLWATTSRQRVRLAEADVAALGHVDDYALVLTRRFATSLAQAPQPRDRAELLKAYAASDLAPAEFPAALASWDQTGKQMEEFAVTQAEPDSEAVVNAVLEAISTRQTVTRSVLGPTGVQILAAVAHPSGGATSVLVLPRTRLLSANPYAALLGMASPSGGDPPYAVALADVSPSIAADTARVRWHRLGDELHGDRLISTSDGTKRAHVEIDLRSVWARAERGVLVLLLDLAAGRVFLDARNSRRERICALDSRPRRALDLYVSRAAYPRAFRVLRDSGDRVRGVVLPATPQRRSADA